MKYAAASLASAKNRVAIKPTRRWVGNCERISQPLWIGRPLTEQAVSKIRPESDRRGRSSSLPWGTLMFAHQPAELP